MYMAQLPCMGVVVLPFMGFLFSGWENKHSSCHHAAISSTNLRKPTSLTYIYLKAFATNFHRLWCFWKGSKVEALSFRWNGPEINQIRATGGWPGRTDIMETPKDSWLEGENDPFSGSMSGFPEVVGIWVERSSTGWDLNLSFEIHSFPKEITLVTSKWTRRSTKKAGATSFAALKSRLLVLPVSRWPASDECSSWKWS